MTETKDGCARHDQSDRQTREGANVRRRLRRQRVVVSAWAAVVVCLALASGAWLGIKASTISHHLRTAVDLVPQLKSHLLSADASAAADTVKKLQAHTAEAREATADPLWITAGALPWVGVNFLAASEVATSADDVAQLAAAPLVSVFQSMDWKTLTPGTKGIDLEPLKAAQPKLVSAAHAVGQSSDRLNAINAGALLPEISAPLTEARGLLQSMRYNLEAAANVSSVAPNMLGSTAPRRYLLLIQNNAETRATGGIPGALALLTVENGKLTLGPQSSAGALGAFNPPVSTDPEQEMIYSVRLGKYMQDVNLTPDFPTTASVAKAMWEKRNGDHLDGVISVDPVALSYILNGTGAVELTDPNIIAIAGGILPTKLTGENVVRTLLSDVYLKISEPSVQDAYFADVAKEIFAAISTGTGDAKKSLDGLSRGVDEGRILVWSAVANDQAVIARYRLSGSISGPSIVPRQFGVYFNDGTGAKMDFYVRRTVQLIEECTGDDYSQIKVRVTSTNTAPADAATSLPPYVTGGGAFGVPPGTVQTNIVAYGPVQSHVDNVVADGKKVSFASQSHGGRPVGTVTVALPPGKSSTIDFLFDKIVQHTEPQLSVTPTIQSKEDLVLETVREKCLPAS